MDMREMNRIKILFFATLRERAGVKSLEIDIPSGMTVEGFKEKLSIDYPNLKESMHAVLITVNREYAFEENVIPPNAEIGMFPPVSGG
jgi:molybdopterin converting factor subunit 1